MRGADRVVRPAHGPPVDRARPPHGCATPRSRQVAGAVRTPGA
ncbi:hypothetical protein STXM2123_470 [Streptomyces sp. F-3]|nr:hypothetical protein STXM2123_470 [Streptomyces sp. F-3]